MPEFMQVYTQQGFIGLKNKTTSTTNERGNRVGDGGGGTVDR